MVACPPKAIVYIDSYYAVNMIHATYIWVLMLLIVGVFIECKNRSWTKMGASTLVWSERDYKMNQIISWYNFK
jgi:hypothetical protein